MGYTDRVLESMFRDRETTCAVCGKKFYREPDHVYKVNVNVSSDTDSGRSNKVLYFCRYNHYVQWLKEHGRW